MKDGKEDCRTNGTLDINKILKFVIHILFADDINDESVANWIVGALPRSSDNTKA